MLNSLKKILLISLLFVSAVDKPVIANSSIINVMANVQVAGAVKKPGVYRIPKGARLVDVLEKAGGLKQEAEISGINLSIPLTDGDSIYIPLKGEKKEIILPIQKETNPGFSDKQLINSPKFISAKPEKPKFLSLNNATKEQLMTLPGVGEKTAEAIIEYRNKKKFSSIYELKNVPRIGDKRMQKLKKLITL